MAISRRVTPQAPNPSLSQEGAGSDGPHDSHTSPAWLVARSLGMVALAMFGILVLLPAAIAAQSALAP